MRNTVKGTAMKGTAVNDTWTLLPEKGSSTDRADRRPFICKICVFCGLQDFALALSRIGL
jgi:hypothetical protein